MNDAVAKQVQVTPQKVLIAKKFLLGKLGNDSKNELEANTLLPEFCNKMDVAIPTQAVDISVDTSRHLTKFADFISWRVALCEAVWALVHAGVAVPTGESLQAVRHYVTVSERGYGHTIDPPQFLVWIPSRFRVIIWSDIVRDARNVLHHNVQPGLPNTYEKVAALLMGAARYIGLLYKMNEAV